LIVRDPARGGAETLVMSYDAALAYLVRVRADEVADVVRILCAMATASHLTGGKIRRDRTIEVAADLASDTRLNRFRGRD
jgi:hypothetical protein